MDVGNNLMLEDDQKARRNTLGPRIQQHQRQPEYSYPNPMTELDDVEVRSDNVFLPYLLTTSCCCDWRLLLCALMISRHRTHCSSNRRTRDRGSKGSLGCLVLFCGVGCFEPPSPRTKCSTRHCLPKLTASAHFIGGSGRSIPGLGVRTLEGGPSNRWRVLGAL